MKILLFFLLLVLSFSVQAQILTGIAKNKKGEVVYIEKHEITVDEIGLNKLIKVEYKKPDGSLLAKMNSDFSKNKLVPETVFEDLRFKSKTVLKIVDSKIEFEEIKDNKSISKKTFDLHESMVAGQGFDNYIRANASRLDEKHLDFKFGVLEKKDFFTLTGYKKPSRSKEHVEYGIKASSWFIRLFAKELKVVYEAKTMKLKSFSGLSNIMDDSGNSQDVTIDYQWAEPS